MQEPTCESSYRGFVGELTFPEAACQDTFQGSAVFPLYCCRAPRGGWHMIR